MFKPVSRNLLLGLLSAATACEGIPPLQEGVETSTQALAGFPDLIPQKGVAGPFRGLVGRGINRRVPMTRLEFTPTDNSSGQWAMAGDERGLCVKFADGVSYPTSVGFESSLRATVIQGEESLKAAVDLRAGLAADANIVFPLDGLPIPVGGSVNDELGFKGALESTSNRATASIFAKASFAAVQGNGAASIRQAVIDNITALPAAERPQEFFKKCGDSYIDEVRLGGYLAIDMTIQANTASSVLDARAKLRRKLNLASLGGDGATTGGEGVLDGVLGLLSDFGLSANQELDAGLHVEKISGDQKLIIQVRHGGPPLPPNPTIQNALDLARNWDNYVKSHKSDLTPMNGKLKVYATTDNSGALGATLPVYAIDNAYNQRMRDYNQAILRHLPRRSYFESMFDLLTTTPQVPADLFFKNQAGQLPNATLAASKADLARDIVVGILNAEQCTMELPPGSTTNQVSACRFQDVDGPGGQGSINVLATNVGDYPFFPRLAEVNIGKTWDDWGKLVDQAGYAITLRSSQDTSDKACILTQSDDKLVFLSGETDDQLPWTGSKCTWDLWNVPLRAGWVVKKAEWKKYQQPDNFSHPDDDDISGTVTANHEWLKKGGVILRTLSFRGPLAMSDFDYESHPREVDFVINP